MRKIIIVFALVLFAGCSVKRPTVEPTEEPFRDYRESDLQQRTKETYQTRAPGDTEAEAIVRVGNCPDINPCPAPGPCTINNLGFQLCWDPQYDTPEHPGIKFEVCALRDGVTDLGCVITYRTDPYIQDYMDEFGNIVSSQWEQVILRNLTPAKYWDNPIGSMVTFTVRTISDAPTNNQSGWVLIDTINWPDVTYINYTPNFDPLGGN